MVTSPRGRGHLGGASCSGLIDDDLDAHGTEFADLVSHLAVDVAVAEVDAGERPHLLLVACLTVQTCERALQVGVVEAAADGEVECRVFLSKPLPTDRVDGLPVVGDAVGEHTPHCLRLQVEQERDAGKPVAAEDLRCVRVGHQS